MASVAAGRPVVYPVLMGEHLRQKSDGVALMACQQPKAQATWDVLADMGDREFLPFFCTFCSSLCQHLHKWASSQQLPVHNTTSVSLCWLLVRDIRLVSLSKGASGKRWRLASLKDRSGDSHGAN